MARSKGRTEYFEPSNTVGLDTRIWQQRGSANKILGAVFTMAGEIVKIDGLRLLIDWDPVEVSRQRLTNYSMRPRLPEYTTGEKPETTSETQEWTSTHNPFSEVFGRNKIFTIGKFTWGETVEILVAWGDEDTVKIGVIESNSVRLLKTIEIQTMDVRPRFYPRFVDVGQFVLILVGGHALLKWDGKLLTKVGIGAPPEPITARFVRGTRDIFFETSSIDRDDAASVRLRYYQTFINKYGQESELSARSNEIFMHDFFGLQMPAEDDVVGSVGTEAVGGMGSRVTTSNYTTSHDDYHASHKTNTTPEKERHARWHQNVITNIGSIAAGDDDFDYFDRAAMVFLDLGEPPDQIDVVERGLYRSINNQLPTALPRRLGPAARTHFDVRRPSESSADPAPAIGENLPPPPATWAFPFRGRTYYGGVPGEPSILYYSALHRPESVSVTSFLEVNANDADRLTGWGLAQDYAIVFKKNSAYLLTHDKSEFPVMTPLQATFGAISDRAVASIDNKTYFMSDVGIHVFDGSKFERISKILDNMVKALPEFSKENAVMWADGKSERVYLAVSANPGSENNEVWVVQTDTGAFSRIAGREVTHGISYKDESIVALYNNGCSDPDLYLWGGGHQIDKASPCGTTSGFWSKTTTWTAETVKAEGEDGLPHYGELHPVITDEEEEFYLEPATGGPFWPGTYPPQPISFMRDEAGIQYDIGGPILGDYETEWLEVGDPNTDKKFYKIGLYFVQTGDIDLNVEWCVDWDDRKPVGSTTVKLEADDATTWSMLNDDGDPLVWHVDHTEKWDKRRVVCKMIDLSEAHGKCIRFRFHTGERPKVVPGEETFGIVPVALPELLIGVSASLESPGGERGGRPGLDTPASLHSPDPGRVDFVGDPGVKPRKYDRPRYEPWRLVGWHLFLEDHGVRSRGTDGVTE